MAVDVGRLKELDAMVRRMGAIVSVFEVRSDPLGNKSFSAFREMMDVYIEMCARELSQGQDFVADGVKPTATEVERIQTAFTKVFGAAPSELSASE